MFSDVITKIRTEAKMTQTQFAKLFSVSQQAVQKWESGLVKPDIDKLLAISKYFNISVDELLLGEGNSYLMSANILPQYNNLHTWEVYAYDLLTEYNQCIEEGLDIEEYKDIFSSIAKLPKGDAKKKFGDVIFDLVSNAKTREDFKYIEPSSLEQIRSLRVERISLPKCEEKTIKSKITGAWMGRICGCMLGKPIEGIRSKWLIPLLKATGNYPMHRYILRSDLTDEVLENCKFPLRNKLYADEIDGMPVDDDTNYVVLAQMVIEEFGKDFTPMNMAKAWMKYQGKDAYCTAERVAYCNFIKGYLPPQSASYQNPYREWVGAQIRGDYFGYINIGNPEKAAEMAFRDASISHVKNGIYGEMFISAMIATAGVCSDMEKIILGGLSEIPKTSRLFDSIMRVIDCFKGGKDRKECLKMIASEYDEYTEHGWCHTISNAMIVAMSLLYGEGDFSKSICIAVESAFDTDCNGATVGSILGMVKGIEGIPNSWKDPINNTLYTSIFNVGKVKISDCVEKTLKHIQTV